ncbi:DivIVA domain-containing protein [Spirillospora sp. CA-142024]|uniref:DivIVA domain-containing protein n=1 Tax=Spirillospora sp. CA-142024 TaxID=3240036 RepID=UPI003D8A7873
MNSPNLPVVSEGSRLTPGELHSVVFARAALGRRGYDEEQVRNFLQYVERELVQIFTDKAALAEEVNRLRAIAAKGTRGVMAPEDAHFQAVRILSQAQQTADLYVADAERYTRELAHEARLHREAILSDAKGRAEQLLEEAHRKAAAVADAAVRAAEQQAPPVRVQALPDDERRAMEREIAYLRTYSDVYRTHLRSYLEALLRNVDEWESSERASLPGRVPD